MIKFFRRIRFNLMSENKTGKYLKYAIGEIILVVIGILIALQINTWNQEKQNRKQESQILTQLLNEYNSNLEQINSKIYIRQEVLKSSLIILNYRNRAFSEINPDSFNLHLSRVITRPTFDPELGVTNELSSSGKLYLIRNSELRNRITSFSSFLSELKEEEIVTFNHVENLFIPFISEHYQLGRVMAEFLNDADFKATFTLDNSEENKSIKDLFPQADIKPILYNTEFEDNIAVMISNTTYTNQQSKGVKEKIEAIIRLIKLEIQD